MPNANVQTTINTASTTGLNKTFFDRLLLKYALPRLVYAKYATKKPIPKNKGKKIEMRRWVPFDPALAMTPLTEGVTPDGLSLEQDIVEAIVAQYGAYFTYSDFLSLTTYDEIMNSGAKRLGELLGDVIDRVVRDELLSGNNVMYGGGQTTRDAVTEADKLNVDLVMKSRLELEKLRAPKFYREGDTQGHYISIINPLSQYDLWNDSLWQEANKYVDPKRMYSGEIGRMFGVVFVVSDNAPVVPITSSGDVTNTVPIFQSVMFGDESYAAIDISNGGAIKSIIKQPGSAGSADPLDQRGTVGAKVSAFASKILNENWVLRMEHAGSLAA